MNRSLTYCEKFCGASYAYDLRFGYDALGNRISKTVIPKNEENGAILPMDQWDFTYYLRDAQGNTLSTMTRNINHTGGSSYTDNLHTTERVIYGSARLGIENTQGYFP